VLSKALSVMTLLVLLPGFAAAATKLVGTDWVAPSDQGFSVALSADGNTAILGGFGDSSNVGAAWIFTRSGGVWTQEGSKLVGTGAYLPAWQGISVGLSGDGNTAIVGGIYDNGTSGAVWVYTRSGGLWSQQGTKLVANPTFGGEQQGSSVALSADGNTAIVGGYEGMGGGGEAWVWTRSGGVWSQQGAALVGTGAVGAAEQGRSVAISGDGNTAIVGGPLDSSSVGAAWVFTRSGGLWSQQGTKLAGTGAVGYALQGISVALSADGNTAIVGGYYDNGDTGAAWVFTRSGGVWSQQGTKLVGTGAVGFPMQGSSVALSGDGNIAIVGGLQDNSGAGAVWVYTRSGEVWSQQRPKLAGADGGGSAYQGSSVALSCDGLTAIEGGYGDYFRVGAAWVFEDPAVASVMPGRRGVPGAVFLSAPSPNPAHDGVTIRFGLPRDATVGLEIYDVAGRLVRELGGRGLESGVNTLNWDLRDSDGRSVKGGLYFVRLNADGATLTDRLVVVR
jgi:FlgD Ig-like domain